MGGEEQERWCIVYMARLLRVGRATRRMLGGGACMPLSLRVLNACKMCLMRRVCVHVVMCVCVCVCVRARARACGIHGWVV